MPEVLLLMRRSGNAKVMGDALARHGYTYCVAGEVAQLEAALSPERRPCAALIDVTGFHEEVWAMCEMLQRNDVPYLMVSAPERQAFCSRGLEFGAAGVMIKPLSKPRLLGVLARLVTQGTPSPPLEAS